MNKIEVTDEKLKETLMAIVYTTVGVSRKVNDHEIFDDGEKHLINTGLDLVSNEAIKQASDGVIDLPSKCAIMIDNENNKVFIEEVE